MVSADGEQRIKYKTEGALIDALKRIIIIIMVFRLNSQGG